MSRPKLEKARTDELTSYEIKQALRELTVLNGYSGVARLTISEAGYCTVIVGDHTTGKFEVSSREPEDALVNAYDKLLKSIAEDAAE